ncbi:MAG: Gfo/Idh/MocA family protein [Opitutales bacterium]
MAAAAPIRVGFIGAGANTRSRHIPGFQAIDGVDLAVVANRSAASSQEVADAFGIPRIAPDWRAVVEDPEVDAVCIGTWPYLHAEATIAALEAGKHVLCEARMAMNLEEAERMAAAAEKRPDQVAQLVPAPFSFNVDAGIRRFIDEGALGQLRELRLEHITGSLADADAPFSWRQDVTLSGINVLTLGIFHEQTLRWLSDNPERVLADAAIHTRERTDPESGETQTVAMPDSLSVLGRFPGGARLIYHFSAVEAGANTVTIRISGSEGTLTVEPSADRLVFHPVQGEAREVAIPAKEKRGWQVEADFINSIREKKPVTLTAFADGLRYMRFTQAVHDSWQAAGAWKLV